MPMEWLELSYWCLIIWVPGTRWLPFPFVSAPPSRWPPLLMLGQCLQSDWLLAVKEVAPGRQDKLAAGWRAGVSRVDGGAGDAPERGLKNAYSRK